MIELNKKTQQDFLNREWVQRLLDAGVDMSDAKYWIVKSTSSLNDGLKDYIVDEKGLLGIEPAWDDKKHTEQKKLKKVPTYTVSELLYKLHEWIYPTINGKEFSGGLKFFKDAPFYVFYYDLKTKNYDKTKPSNEQIGEWDESFMGESEFPIESLASLLIQCHKKDIGIKDKNGNQISDTGDITDK